MIDRRLAIVLALAMLAPLAARTAQEVIALDGDVAPVHDPVVIKEKGVYYLFCTGGRNGQGVLPIPSSADMLSWKAAGFVMESLPAWATEEIPMARNAWAPDISFFNGRYLFFHAYFGEGRGRGSALQISTLVWEDGWPKAGVLP